jgi:hypothetical protein
VTTVLDPRASPNEIAELIEIYCHQHMVMLIEHLLVKFRNAQIVMAAYYEILTEHSEDGYIHALLKGLGKAPAGFAADMVIEVAQGLIKRRLLANSDVFAERSLAAFKQTAEEVNRQLGEERVFVACPNIGQENAAFAPDSWLFGINDDLSPQDPAAQNRIEACHCAGASRTVVLFCEKASAGHPNPKGAKAYAESILSLLMERVQP